MGNEQARLLVTLPFPVEELGGHPVDFDYNVFHAGDPVEALSNTSLWVTPYLEAVDYASILPTMGQLSVVQAQSAGTDDIAAWLPLGTTLCNARGVHDAATAEMAATLILASLRRLPAFVTAQARSRWQPDNGAQSLADKTVLILGYGSIGRALGRRLAGFECDVVGVTRHGRDGSVRRSELPALLPGADVVVVLTPLTSETHHMVSADFLSRMKDHSLLVNMARGPVVDTHALLAEVRAGRLNAALDVTDPEPLPPEHELWRCPTVLITPHAGGGTSAMTARIRRLVRTQLFSFAAHEPLANVVTIR